MTQRAGRTRESSTGAIREGYLLLADISGYTAFLTETELEHAQAIIAELVNLIRARLAPPLRFVKVEGDAVFCFGDAGVLRAGERLVELIEVCYFDFSQRLFSMARATTCRCAACASIDLLDLKFVAHYGQYIIHAADARVDVAGPDVILVHRLLKNTVTERTGVRTYALFTDACVAHLPAPFDLPGHVETYEPFGDTPVRIYDLTPTLAHMRDATREYLSADDADHEVIISVRQPPPVVWQYLVDPVQRLRWACVLFNREPDASAFNARGRSGVGAKSHCNHGPGDAYREIVDWRPFQYFTTRGTSRMRPRFLPERPIFETFELTEEPDGGTRLAWRLKFEDHSRIARWTLKAMTRLVGGGIGKGSARLERAIEEDLAT